MLKKCFAVLVILALLVVLPLTVYADKLKVSVNGEEVKFDYQEPIIKEGRTLIPIRGVFELLGFEIKWDEKKQQITLSGDGVIVITIDSKNFYTNGVSHSLEVPAQIINGRTMLPIRAVIESLGFYVDWDAVNSTVVVNGKEQKKNENQPDVSARNQEFVDVTYRFIGKTVTISSVQNGKYVSSRQNSKDSPLYASADKASAWERFEVVSAENGYAAFRADNKRYVSAVINNKDVPLRSTASKIQNWERFRIFEHDGSYYIQAFNGRWVSAAVGTKNSPLRAAASNPRSWERFIISIIYP